MKKKLAFREHVKTSSRAACPRQSEIQDRRAFIASLGGVLVGGMMLGCGDDGESTAKPADGGVPDAALPDMERLAGTRDSFQSKLDTRRPWDINAGWPDIDPAPGDMGDLFPHRDLFPQPEGTMGVPPQPDRGPDMPPAKPDMGYAGLPPPPPDMSLQPDRYPHPEVGPAGMPPMPDSSVDLVKPKK